MLQYLINLAMSKQFPPDHDVILFPCNKRCFLHHARLIQILASVSFNLFSTLCTYRMNAQITAFGCIISETTQQTSIKPGTVCLGTRRTLLHFKIESPIRMKIYVAIKICKLYSYYSSPYFVVFNFMLFFKYIKIYLKTPTRHHITNM